MASLTPEHREQEVTSQAMQEGLTNGAIALGPCLAGLYIAMKNPSFRKVRRDYFILFPSVFHLIDKCLPTFFTSTRECG
jgi:hypothetical protein